jgi:hypothetical protein
VAATVLGFTLGLLFVALMFSDDVAFSPPASYTRWWRETEQCSGLAAPMAGVTFGVMLNEYHLEQYAGYTLIQRPPHIVIAPALLDDPITVKHEMLHALLILNTPEGQDVPSHPRPLFVDACGVM